MENAFEYVIKNNETKNFSVNLAANSTTKLISSKFISSSIVYFTYVYFFYKMESLFTI